MNPLERAGYLAHASSARFRRRVQESAQLIREYAAEGYTVSTSWGKDSTVLTHLAASLIEGPLPVCHGRLRPEQRFPDLDRPRDAVLALRPNIAYWEEPWIDEWDLFERAGGFFMEAETEAQREAVRWYTAERARGKRQTGDRVMLGVRASESQRRRHHVGQRGAAYTRQADGQQVLMPLAFWQGEDIWAYLVLHGLPWAHIYDVGINGRARTRNEYVFASLGSGMGEFLRRQGLWQEWQTAYPDHFQAWLDRWPEMGERMV